MELLDMYDENGRKIGRTIIRGTPIRHGEYSMSVHMYIYNSDGRFLLQKRSEWKRSLPGIWSVTCGAVSAGEDSVTAGIREAQEEIGLCLDDSQFEFIDRIKRRHSFIDIFFVKAEFDISKCILQKEEVDAVKFCSAIELLESVQSSEDSGGTYSSTIQNALKLHNFL